jgi:hypothetical protein
MENARVFYSRLCADWLAAVLTPVLSSADGFDIAHCLILFLVSTFLASTRCVLRGSLLCAVSGAARGSGCAG